MMSSPSSSSSATTPAAPAPPEPRSSSSDDCDRTLLDSNRPPLPPRPTLSTAPSLPAGTEEIARIGAAPVQLPQSAAAAASAVATMATEGTATSPAAVKPSTVTAEAGESVKEREDDAALAANPAATPGEDEVTSAAPLSLSMRPEQTPLLTAHTCEGPGPQSQGRDPQTTAARSSDSLSEEDAHSGPGTAGAAEPPLPPPSTTPGAAATFASMLQELQQRFTTQVEVDIFIDPTDRRNITTTLELPDERQGTQGTRQEAATELHERLPREMDSKERVAALRRAKSPWEKRAKGVALFASSSDEDAEHESTSDARAVSPGSGSALRLGDNASRDSLGRAGVRRGEAADDGLTARHVCPDVDELDEMPPAAAVAQRAKEAQTREKQRRKLVKEAARRMVFKNLENTVASASSGSQQGVSTSSASAGVTPQRDQRHSTGRKRTDRRLRFSGTVDALQEAEGRQPPEGEDEGEEVLVEQDAGGPGPSAEGRREGKEAALVPYVPSLKGPVAALRALYGNDAAGTLRDASSLFSWRPAVAPCAQWMADLPESDTLQQPPRSSSGPSPPLFTMRPEGPTVDANWSSTLHAVLSVTIRGMSPLHADVGVVHPFVRVWLVHCVTGENLIRSGTAVPCAITHPYDLRAHGSRSPWWEAEMAVRLDVELVRRHQKTGVLLFEVLDCGNESIYGFYLPRNGLYPICWGFLMLHDCYGQPGALFAENVHVQLYRYPARTAWYIQWAQSLLTPWCSSSAINAPSEFYMDETGVLSTVKTSALAAGDDAQQQQQETTERSSLVSPASPASLRSPIPAVFTIFKSPLYRNLTYDGGLIVTVKAPPSDFYVPKPAQMLPYEEYLLNLLVAGGGSCAVPRRESSSSTMSGDADARDAIVDPLVGGRAARLRASMRSMSLINQRALGQEYARHEGERVLLPTSSLQTVPVPGVVTCMAFFRHTPILAVGVTRHLQYVVELRNTMQPELPVLAQMYGFTEHIHSISVQKDDRFVLACSSDKTVRVWRVTDLSHTILAALNGNLNTPNAAQLVVEPACVLPHAHPVYGAIFHQDTIITAGYSPQLQVWRYDKLLSTQGRTRGAHRGTTHLSESPTQAPLSSERASSLQLTATFTPGLSVSDVGSSRRPAREAGEAEQQLGELICTTDTENDGIVLSVASNEHSGRLWTVASGGSVCCWRALYEVASEKTKGGPGGRRGTEAPEAMVWQMSVRRRSDCAGASRVHVAGNFAVVTCRTSPVVYIFDATTCESVRVVNTRLRPDTPIRLLPDGEAFVAGTAEGHLAAWDCADGAVCTPSQGDYSKVKTKFPIVDMVWAERQQLAALQSPAPCPEAFLPTYGVVPPSLAALYGSSPSQWPTSPARFGVPTEVTLIAVVGSSRSTCRPITASDKHAPEDFCARCGGDVASKRRAAQQAARSRALRRQQAEHESRKTRLYKDSVAPRTISPTALAPTSLFPDPDAAFGTAFSASAPGRSGASDLDFTEAGLRINTILNFWRGLTRQHRHTGADGDSGADSRATGGEESAARPAPISQRLGRYTAWTEDRDDNLDSL